MAPVEVYTLFMVHNWPQRSEGRHGLNSSAKVHWKRGRRGRTHCTSHKRIVYSWAWDGDIFLAFSNTSTKVTNSMISYHCSRQGCYCFLQIQTFFFPFFLCFFGFQHFFFVVLGSFNCVVKWHLLCEVGCDESNADWLVWTSVELGNIPTTRLWLTTSLSSQDQLKCVFQTHRQCSIKPLALY